MKRLWIFLFVPILMVACETTTDETVYEAIDTQTQAWPVAGLNEVAVSTENGNISVTAVAGDSIIALISRTCTSFSQEDADAHLDCVVVTQTIAGDTLMLAAEMPNGGGDRNYYGDFGMTSPATLYYMLSVVNGNVVMTDMASGAAIQIVNGTITVDNLDGGVNGSIVNGNIDCDLASLELGESALLQATNGNIILTLPVNVSATFSALTVSGTVMVSGFTFVDYFVDEPNHKVGNIGGGEVPITLLSTNGNISIIASN
jgi:DUF4097 and DUF4098 domain-containing protein YvlB